MRKSLMDYIGYTEGKYQSEIDERSDAFVRLRRTEITCCTYLLHLQFDFITI